MPFLAIILDADIILESFLSKIIKKTLPGSLQTVVRSGDASQMVAFSKFGQNDRTEEHSISGFWQKIDLQ